MEARFPSSHVALSEILDRNRYRGVEFMSGDGARTSDSTAVSTAPISRHVDSAQERKGRHAMATVSRTTHTHGTDDGGLDNGIPPLEAGDRLSRAEFERRYKAMPQLKRAELIEGVVYMPSPVRLTRHGRPHFDLVTWLAIYKAATPGVIGADNTSTRLDLDNEPQPDAVLFIDPAHGGQARISPDDYVEGAPELVAEVASSSVSYDLTDKLKVYRRNGVREYIVWRVLDRQIDWFVSEKGNMYVCRSTKPACIAAKCFPVSGSTRLPWWAATPQPCLRPSSAAWPAPSTPTSSRGLNAQSDFVTHKDLQSSISMREITAETAAEYLRDSGRAPHQAEVQGPRAERRRLQHRAARRHRGPTSLRDQAVPRAAARRDGLARPARADLDRARHA